MTIWVPEEVEERERREKRSANCIMDKQYNNNSDGGSSSLQLFFIVYAIILHHYTYIYIYIACHEPGPKQAQGGGGFHRFFKDSDFPQEKASVKPPLPSWVGSIYKKAAASATEGGHRIVVCKVRELLCHRGLRASAALGAVRSTQRSPS